MAALKITEGISEQKIENEVGKIRRHFDKKSRIWYFSVADVIAATTKSSDPRNYWKVLKNRLKNTNYELVTKCNQLKMPSKDGKFYLTDVADSETIIKIIESVPRASVEAFKLLIKDIERASKSGQAFSPFAKEIKPLSYRDKKNWIRAKCACEKSKIIFKKTIPKKV